MAGWNIYVWNNSTLTWDSDGTIDRPNDTLSQDRLSNQQKILLADGSPAYVVPETYVDKQSITLVWFYKLIDLKSQIESYMNDHDYIKIETHVSGIQFIGRFIQFSPIWLTGISPDRWDITATFEVME